jgi:hypothetical protein
MIGSIYLGKTEDESGTLWDVVEASEEAEEILGMKMPENAIIETPSDVAVELGIDGLWVVYAHSVISLIPWEDDDGAANGGNEAEESNGVFG